MVPLQRSPRPRVAIAEDDDDERLALERSLEAEGFEVISFEDGFELADYLAHASESGNWPCAVVTDLHMPGCTGLEAIEQLRRQCAHIPVFVVTGLPDSELRDRAARLGNTLIFQKPIALEHLANALRALAKLEVPAVHPVPQGQ